MSTPAKNLGAAMNRRKAASKPLAAASAAAVAGQPATVAEPTEPAKAAPAAATPPAKTSAAPKPAKGRGATKRPPGTKRVTLDADAEALATFQARIKELRWSQRTGLTAALLLLTSLPDDEVNDLCGKAQAAEVTAART